MSCYTRHLGDLFALAGIVDTKENRRRADRFIRGIIGLTGEGCPAVWREVKGRLADPDKSVELADRLRQAFITNSH